uniref:EF-hand domain-containing protein n=1 Tax=Chrysotila carterae TaxID=13221 RepID=A0A7S4BMJ7_CHRCT
MASMACLMRFSVVAASRAQSRLLCSSDMGTALALARDGLWRCADAQSVEALLRGCVACARACVLGAAELSSRRQRARVRLLIEAQRLEAARVLLRVQRASGLAVADVRALAALSLGDDGVLRAADLDVGWIQIGVQRDAFAQIVAALVPHWSAHSPLLPLLFEVFRTRVVMPGLPSDAAAEADAQRDETRDDAPVLSFLRLVSGLGWLLRGSSARRAELCFHCFDREGCGAVTRADFIAVLCYIYALYEDLGASPLRNAHAHATRVAERVQAEATRFVDMMFELWDEEGVGLLSRARFDRAAHQHPLLVQTFQLEQLDSPQVRQPLSAAPAAPTQPQTTSSTRVTSAADRTPKACVKSRTTTTSSTSAAIVQSPLLKIRDDYFSEDVRRL